MKTYCTLLVLVVTLTVGPLTRVAKAQEPPRAKTAAERTKADVSKRMANGKTKVTIKLATGGELRGIISDASENTFKVKDEKTGQITDVNYQDVAKVKGKGLSKWTKIGIVTGAAVVVFAVVVVVSLRNFDPFEHGILAQR